jgi:uncharacterized protein with HEPN domain
VKYPGVEWKKAMGMRDFIAHHYFDIDHEIVYGVCTDHVPEMKAAVRRILNDLRKK